MILFKISEAWIHIRSKYKADILCSLKKGEVEKDKMDNRKLPNLCIPMSFEACQTDQVK